MAGDRFAVVFRGMWHGYNTINHAHTMNAEEYADVSITDAGTCIHSKAGCRSSWLTYPTAAKMGAALIAAAVEGVKRGAQPLVFILHPRRKTLKTAIMEGVTEIHFKNGYIHIADKKRSVKVWSLTIGPSPQWDEVRKEETANRALLLAAIKSLLIAARKSEDPAITAAVMKIYDGDPQKDIHPY
jgi:hypothetical protein